MKKRWTRMGQLIGSQRLQSMWAWMLWPSHSIHKTNKHRDKRLSWWTPLVSLNVCIGTSFHRICKVEFVIANIIALIRRSWIPVVFKETSIHSHWTQSYAFSKSILTASHILFFYWIFIEWTTSCVMMMLSVMFLPVTPQFSRILWTLA